MLLRTTSFVAGVIALLVVSAPAFAGGWAVTTLDSLPATIQAGQTYRIGYMIRQHGVLPFTQATPAIRVSLGDQQLTFKGIAEGEPGHYVSNVEFPGGGEWTWSVDQAPFAVQQLGALKVAPPEPVRPAVYVPTEADQRNAVLIAAGLLLLPLVALVVWRPLMRRTT
jgi:hypothetical protein